MRNHVFCWLAAILAAMTLMNGCSEGEQSPATIHERPVERYKSLMEEWDTKKERWGGYRLLEEEAEMYEGEGQDLQEYEPWPK
ncbi:hypothetical protein [Desulfomonile tiedjei]|uniref:Uncharacterized protein n=1 Tax=Desulfomonile tiedjei (strain ATCC 49306 / DSM 6799 / DCB-1) TaxID=706587 RepID=I4C2C7_DESTA|nr:hypothetical protein [Desulfomonile tiedjei]AFM23718.1 hypothetical protein Desti_1000 [Desulfomonile tiedjei DSM 6799]